MLTKEFLQHFPGFALQTFDDNSTGDKDSSLISCGRPDKYGTGEITALNKRGAGIYFTPNSFPTGERKAKLCTKVNAWIVENDTLTIDQQWEKLKVSPLPPSFIIQSKNSLHAYWLAKDAKIENYERIVKGLIKYFDGDQACKDISRVFRIPGFNHLKDRANPFMVGIVEAEPTRQYTDEQMLVTFPFQEEPKLLYERVISTNDFWSLLGSLDNKSVLIRLSGHQIINREIIEFKKRPQAGEYIYVNGKMCDGWIDEKGMIGSGKRGGPTWIQWLGFYGVPKNEIARWAKDNLEEVKQWAEKNEPKPVIKKIENQVIVKQDYKLRYTWGTRDLDTSFAIIKRGNFIVAAAKSNAGKTTFVFDMACKNAKLGHKVLFLSLEMDTNDILDDFGRKFAGITIEEELDYKIPNYKQEAYNRKVKELNTLQNLMLKGIRRTGDVTWEMITEVFNYHKDIDMVFIDNLDLIAAIPGESDNDRQKRIVKSILTFTSSSQIPLILIHHYRKSPAEGKDKGMDEMTGSGKIKDGADRVIKITRCNDPDGIYPDKYRTNVYLQKGRGYPEAIKDIYFIRGTFVDIPPKASEYYGTQEAEEIANQFNGIVL